MPNGYLLKQSGYLEYIMSIGYQIPWIAIIVNKLGYPEKFFYPGILKTKSDQGIHVDPLRWGIPMQKN
jgi:hypothetical protein